MKEKLITQSMEFGGPALNAWPTRKGEKLRPGKGGDGGAKDAARREAERQARVDAAVSAINQTFSDPTRNTLYDEQRKAVYDINARDVAKQYEAAERANRFGLARSGLIGGSADIDSVANLQETNNEGLVKASGIADAAASDLKKADESSKQTLISLAQSGIDTGTAAQMAANNMNANAQAAAGSRAGSSLSGLFNDLSKAYLINQYYNGMNTGRNNALSQQTGVAGLNTRSGDSGSVQNR